jgi:hypothetical protein
VIGTIIAALRVDASGRIKVAWPPAYAFVAGSFQPARRELDADLRRANNAALDAAFSALDSEARALGCSAAARRIGAGATRLRALRNCLDAVHDPRLYRALANEINTNLARLRRDLAGSRQLAALAEALRPLACGVDDLGDRSAPTPVTHSAIDTVVDTFGSGVL